MIVGVSICDLHKPEGEQHVGTYMFEIDYPADSHFDIKALSCTPGAEATVRPFLNRLLKKEDIPDPVKC